MGLHSINNLTVLLILSFEWAVITRNAPHFSFIFITRRGFNQRNFIYYKSYIKNFKSMFMYDAQVVKQQLMAKLDIQHCYHYMDNARAS